MNTNQEIDDGKATTQRRGIGRVAFLIWFLVWAVIAAFASGTFESGVPWLVANLVILVPASASRLNNMGSRSAWCWLCMVPVLGLFVALRCLIAPPGYAQSKKLDLPAKIFTGTLAAAILIGIAVMLWEEFMR